MTDNIKILTAKSGFVDHGQLEDSVHRRLRQRQTTGNGNIAVLAPIVLLPVVRNCRHYSVTLLPMSPWSKNPDYRWNFDAVYHSFSDINISGFVGHITVSGCRRPLLQSPADIFFELYMVYMPLEFQWHLS